MIDLSTLWFVLFLLLLAIYCVLDGFDLGVGVLHLFTSDQQRRGLHLESIGPVWDGNEVWLLAGGGVLFAAFPVAYATIFSSFYLALMLLLVALILRAVALEFVSKLETAGWQRFWHAVFGGASVVPALLYGVAVGNVVRGLPLTADHTFTGSFLGLLNPYALLAGVTSLAWFTLHGAAWLQMQAESDHRAQLGRLVGRLVWVVVVLLAALLAFTFVSLDHVRQARAGTVGFAVTLILLAGALGQLVRAQRRGRAVRAFLASAVGIVAVVALAGVALYPHMVPSSTDLANSLTIANASSTPRTLKVMLIIALLGLPFVIGYTIWMYVVFTRRQPEASAGY